MRTCEYALAALAATLVTATPLVSRSPRAVSLPIQRKQIDTEKAIQHDRHRMRRQTDNTVLVDLENAINLYYINVTLGTPAQSIQVHLDTGSADLWVNVPTSSICGQGQCVGGEYNPSDSSTHEVVSTNFDISYVDGNGASGDYNTDTLGISGLTLDTFQFGTGEDSTLAQGVLGIGYTLNEVQVNRFGQNSYPNLPVALKNANHIAATAYSIWLNDLQASTGEILFGGVDSDKYTGDLLTMPILQVNGLYQTIAVALTGISINGTSTGSSDLPLGVLLDTGSTLSYLPNDMLTPILNDVNAVWSDQFGAAFAACSLANTDRSLSFNFSGAVINVPYNELLLPVTTQPGTGPRLQNGEEACYFGISESNSSVAILGDTFLRSAYVVYDLENNAVSMANTAFNATSSNIREISSGSSGVPGATAIANPVTDVSVAGDASSGGGRIGGPSDGNSSSSAASISAAASDFAFCVALLAACLAAY
jgi:hypothetical protein